MRKALRRSQVLPFFTKLLPCLVGIEACGTSHRWTRELTELGHEVRLIPAKGLVTSARSPAVWHGGKQLPGLRISSAACRLRRGGIELHRAGDRLPDQILVIEERESDRLRSAGY